MECTNKLQKGFGLVEIVIVTALVTTALFAFSQAGVLSVKLLRNEKENLEGVFLAQEALEAVRSIRDESWTNNIQPLSNGTLYYPQLVNGKWSLSTVSPGLISGKYTRYVIFNQVLRDAQDRISSSGTADTNTRKVTARLEWRKNVTSGAVATSSMELITYIANFLESLPGSQEQNVIFFEGATTDGNLAGFPSDNAGNGDPVQTFTTLGSTLQVTKVELYLKRITASPSNIYAELRTSPTGTVLGTSVTITSSTIASTTLGWVEFRFPNQVPLNALTQYTIRLRSIPTSTDAFSGSQGTIHWGYQQTPLSPYTGGDAIRYVGRLSNPADQGQMLTQYDFGFRVYALQ